MTPEQNNKWPLILNLKSHISNSWCIECACLTCYDSGNSIFTIIQLQLRKDFIWKAHTAKRAEEGFRRPKTSHIFACSSLPFISLDTDYWDFGIRYVALHCISSPPPLGCWKFTYSWITTFLDPYHSKTPHVKQKSTTKTSHFILYSIQKMRNLNHSIQPNSPSLYNYQLNFHSC